VTEVNTKLAYNYVSQQQEEELGTILDFCRILVQVLLNNQWKLGMDDEMPPKRHCFQENLEHMLVKPPQFTAR